MNSCLKQLITLVISAMEQQAFGQMRVSLGTGISNYFSLFEACGDCGLLQKNVEYGGENLCWLVSRSFEDPPDPEGNLIWLTWVA